MTPTEYFLIWCIGAAAVSGVFLGSTHSEFDWGIGERALGCFFIFLAWPIAAAYLLWPTRKNG